MGGDTVIIIIYYCDILSELIYLHLLLSGNIVVVRDDQSRSRQESKPTTVTANFVPNKDIQFGYHRASGRQIRITNDGLRAEKIDLIECVTMV